MTYPNYPQYQQYMNPYQQYQQPYQPMQQTVQPAQVQPVQSSVQQYANNQFLSGKFVDSIEGVKATDVLMDGTPMFFPTTDLKTVYSKQLQADGTSKLRIYAEINQDENTERQPSVTEIIDGRFKAFRDDVMAGFEDINDRFDKIERQLKPKAPRGGKEE